jgi:alginate O-acetyltransferase complex protein AlgJ
MAIAVLNHLHFSLRNSIIIQRGTLVSQQSRINKLCVLVALFAIFLPLNIWAQEDPVIIGKNDWLFVRHEIVLEAQAKEIQLNLELIEKVSKLLRASNVILALAIVPSKMETHTEHLPDGFKVSAYMSGFNDYVLATLRSKDVQLIDLKKNFRAAALKDVENPPFFRLDTHWNNTGAYVAAQTLAEGILANPILKNALDETLIEAYELSWAPKRYRQRIIRDITKFLPPGTPLYPPEESRRFTVMSASQQKPMLLGAAKDVGVTLVGSSYSADWLGFPDALRFSLQRNVINFSVNSDIGSFGAMRRYLQDDSFQTNKPKLLIWEIPERSIPVGPNAIRLTQYRINRAEWLYEVAALTQRDCRATSISAKPETANQKFSMEGGRATKETDFVEISFDKSFDVRSYFSAKLKVDGPKQITLEALDGTALVRRFTVDTVGDDTEHFLKTPLSVSNRPINRLKIYPGVANSFSVKDTKVCSYPDNV